MQKLQTLGVWALVLPAACVVLLHAADAWGAAAKPNPPITSRYSVKGFVGGTKTLVLALYPPLTFTDGTPIPAGTNVKVHVYRSYDRGKTYGVKGVKLIRQRYIDFRNPETGQNRFDPARISWIDCTVETPVDPPKSDSISLLGIPADGKAGKQDTIVYLAASVEINGVQSARTNRYLTFRYAVGGIPGLVRYETTDTSGQVVPTQLSRAPAVVLADRHGLWKGTYMLTAITVPAGVRNSPEFRQQGCQQALDQLERTKGKEAPLTVKVTSIRKDSMLPPNPVRTGRDKDGKPIMRHVPIYPGTAQITMSPANNQGEPQTVKSDLVYYQHRSCVVLSAAKREGSLEMIGDLLENATHYEIHGPFRLKVVIKGREMAFIHGMWLVRRRK